MICKKCGTVLPTDSNKCSSCGHENNINETSNNNFFTQKNNNHDFLRFIIVLLCLIGLCTGIIFFVISLNKVHLTPQKTQEALYGKRIKEFNEAEFKESLKNSASDINGLTQFEKYEMGLKYYDGSDSDRDGLSDKDEIELYGSDPLNPSTSGDQYTDGYKIKHEMDINKNYDSEYPNSETEYEKNECPEIVLNLEKNILNVNAVVKNVTGTDKIKNLKITSEYHIYNYAGKLTIKKDALNNMSPNFYIIKNDEILNLKKINIEETATEYLLDYEFEYDNNYYLLVTKSLQNLVSDKIETSIEDLTDNVTDSVTDILPETTETQYAIISGFPFLAQSDFFNKAYRIRYNATKKPTAIAESELNDYCNKIIQLGPDHINEIEIVDEYMLRWTINIYNSALKWFKYPEDGNINLLHCFFCYEVKEEFVMPGQYDEEEDDDADDNNEEQDENSDDDQDEPTEPNPHHTDFDITKDTLPFQNFGTLRETGGHCAAFSYLTVSLYNKGSYPSSGTYTINEEVVNWDLTQHPENKTLTDKILSDYKDADFINNRNITVDGKTVISNLSEDELQFENMMDCTLYESNAVLPLEFIHKDIDADIPYELITKTIDKLNNNQICDFGFYIPKKSEIINNDESVEDSEGCGHAVNIIDYFNDKYNPDVTWFRIYDSNNPGLVLLLKVTKKINENGTETFWYSYPYSEEPDIYYEIQTTNYVKPGCNYALIISDEYMKRLYPDEITIE